jgi:hypothetical protein
MKYDNKNLEELFKEKLDYAKINKLKIMIKDIKHE